MWVSFWIGQLQSINQERMDERSIDRLIDEVFKEWVHTEEWMAFVWLESEI